MCRAKVAASAVLAAFLGGAGCGGDGDLAQSCEGFVEPERQNPSSCAEVDPDAPTELVACEKGSGHMGAWVVDADGLPAYDYQLEERCDSIAESYTPRETPFRDAIHLLGNGRGVLAMARASGAVELYTQDRGHKWINRVDTWRDNQDESFPEQIGGGHSYLVVDREVRSTRFEDLPTGEATSMQTRRFGVGYYETVTTYDDLRVTRRVYAPDADVRALVVDVTLENLTLDEADDSGNYIDVGLVEFWDLNMYQLPPEIATSDILQPNISEIIDRRRRQLNREFEHTLSYNKGDRVAVSATTAKALPDGVTDRRSVSDVDYFPDPVFLATIDNGDAPDAVWLSDEELWSGTTRSPPKALRRDGDLDTRELQMDGEGQHGVLALRVPVTVPVGSPVTRRFAFGYVPQGDDLGDYLSFLRANNGELLASTLEGWRERLAWVAVPGQDSGMVQRELAWASYNLQAGATYDELYGLRVLGQGGAYKYIHGLDGAIGDLAIFADALIHIDPSLAKETLAYAMSTQHDSTSETPWRFPYATTGVASYSDVVVYNQRSDAYFLMPSVAARYVAHTRDREFFEMKVPFWPPGGEVGSSLDHLSRSLDYANQELGVGARGIVAMGTGDYADGVLNLAGEGEEVTPQGTSSVYNAGFVVYGFELLASLLDANETDLAEAFRVVYNEQAQALESQAWNGSFYERGFVDSGNPLGQGLFFLEPQLFPILAGLVEDERRDALLDLIGERLETDTGAVSVAPIGDEPSVSGVDQPQIGGIWPVANAWLTEAYSLRDPAAAWDSFVRNTLGAHATAYPNLWYGIWTGPDSFNGPDSERPGEADAHAATALTDYPALNMHVHAGPMRALVSLLGIQPGPTGWFVAPRLPSETFNVVLPRLELRGTPTSLGGSFVASGTEIMVMEVLLPSGLHEAGVVVKVKDLAVEFTRNGNVVTFDLPVRLDERTTWEVTGT